ncbi:uncharacterized protein LOC143285263 [Babylonia areolata]|uniref:uncharacterized protein LOC143285263 n=1 Tax=Babylonia areolata TaxID=304850 RepID=UPI003FD6ACD4
MDTILITRMTPTAALTVLFALCVIGCFARPEPCPPENWRPEIDGVYMPSRQTIQVTVQPPHPAASDYYLWAERWADPSVLYQKKRRVSKSDTKLVYELTGIPPAAANYTILVRPVDLYGEPLIQCFLSSPRLVAVPSESDTTPSKPNAHLLTTTTPTTTMTTHSTSSSSSPLLSSSLSSSQLLSSSPSFPTSKTVAPSIIIRLPVTIGKSRKNHAVGSSTATDADDDDDNDDDGDGDHHPSSGFHMEKWVIVTLVVIVVLFVAFIVVMVYVGKRCGRKAPRRSSFRSQTSQDRTMSETLPCQLQEMPLQPRQSPQQQQQQQQQQQCISLLQVADPEEAVVAATAGRA